MDATDSMFACSACGKQYRLKPQLAGRKVKCQCGNVMTAPEMPAAAAEENLYDFVEEPKPAPKGPPKPAVARPATPVSPTCPACGQALAAGAVLCVGCGYDLRAGKKHSTRLEAGSSAAAPVAPAVATAAVPVGVVPYRAPMSHKDLSEGSSTITDSFRDLILPCILIAVGAVLQFVEVRMTGQARTLAVAVPVVAVKTAIGLVLVFAGILIASKLMDMGLGPIGQALLKIAAVALVPATVANILSALIGPGSFYLTIFIGLILYYVLFKVFFDMDFQESLICVGIIWVVETWATMLILGLMFGRG